MINISKLKKLGDALFNVYFLIGAAMMGILAFCVIFTVIMRYFFSLAWKEIEEFTGIIFAFSTLWGMGLCILKNEHVTIDVLFDILPPNVKRWLSLVNYLIVFVINGLFFYHGLNYVASIGDHLSKGMMIRMSYFYSMIPISCVIAAVCIVIKMIETVKAPLSSFEKKELTE